jgi:tryptophanase
LNDLELPGLESVTDGQAVSFSNVRIELHPNNRITLFAVAKVPGRDEIPIVMDMTVRVERRRRISFADPEFRDDSVPENLREDSKALSQALLDALNNMVDLDRFNLDGVMLRLNRLETQGKKLIFSGYAQIGHFPRNP